MKKILIFGALADCDITLGTFLINNGYDVTIARHQRYQYNHTSKGLVSPLPNSTQIKYTKKTIDLIKETKKADLIITFTGSLPLSLHLWWVFKKVLDLPPTINIPTGSDMSELINKKKFLSYVYKYVLKSVNINLINPRKDFLQTLNKHNIKNVSFFRYPHRFLKKNCAVNNFSEIIFFHPTRIDFLSQKKLKQSKGNDIFFEEFDKALASGLNAKCYLIEHGKDWKYLQEKTSISKYSNNYIWLKKLRFEEYVKYMNFADVIVDQFYVGWMGGIAHEAMSLGKPVLTYVSKASASLLYGSDLPPILNCNIKKESLCDTLLSCNSKKELLLLGSKGQKWLVRNHGWHICIKHFNNIINSIS
ncbi:glycosyltransferase [Desulfovibrio sp. UCD-KL4C]|uniref:glycosyltransferase n=1 Tax=Desulfovibrio sp. UCD-KL4C TaxID=2578120 RepID=UPI0025BC0B70|nr:glycosyltransferase [Desulfovibrio sp. UCD-KL4C]